MNANAAIPHGIKADGLFEVVAADKTGRFTAGTADDPSGRWHVLAGAERVVRHCMTLGYAYTDAPPGLLLPGEVTIVRRA